MGWRVDPPSDRDNELSIGKVLLLIVWLYICYNYIDPLLYGP
jgi:uncharacterized protein YhhL (DUF1145 family)